MAFLKTLNDTIFVKISGRSFHSWPGSPGWFEYLITLGQISETHLKNVTVRSSDESRRFDSPVRVADLSKNQDLNRPSQ